MTCATTLISTLDTFSFSGEIISNKLLRTLLKLLLLPITVSIGFEFIRYAGKHQNIFTKILSAPGLWMQRITTKEPDDDMIEVAIVSLKSALPDKYPVIEELERQAEALAAEAEKSSVNKDVAEDDKTATENNNESGE
jgi:uncharacterized protein YqhQ